MKFNLIKNKMFDLNSQQNVCRICFDKEIRLTDIFSTMKMDLIPLNEMLKFCTNIEVRFFIICNPDEKTNLN